MSDNLPHDALEAGVPWWLAREAVASTRLDRDETHVIEDAATDTEEES